MTRSLVLFVLLMSGPVIAGEGAVGELLGEYRAAGAGSFDTERGRALWQRERVVGGERRSCVSCHAADLRGAGRHARTGNVIQPLAPSVNAGRLRNRREIEKWLTRNCKWTLGRVCTPQERGDLLVYIQTQ